VGAPCFGIHPTAIIGDPPQHRDFREARGGNPFSREGYVAPVVAATALIEAFVTVDAGCEAATRVGERTWLMKYVHVGHDAVIGDDCELAPQCSVGGHVEIGDGVRVGQGAVFRPFVKVGAGARIGAGAVVVKDVPPGEVWAGNPARLLPGSRGSELESQ
jgi:acyl-[acyl carrier protein]--UDP-N-acetylglucosamine O-acyltransferase